MVHLILLLFVGGILQLPRAGCSYLLIPFITKTEKENIKKQVGNFVICFKKALQIMVLLKNPRG
jgi:hypothetical protein